MKFSTLPRKTVPVLAAAVLAGVFVAGTSLAEDLDAAKLWSKNCQTCHGPDGKGKTKAGEKAKVKDLTSAEVKSKLTKEKAAEAIKNGVKEEGGDKMAMKAYADKLTPAEIDALAAHTLTFK